MLIGGTTGELVWSVARLHAVSGMVSIGSKLKNNCWVQGRIDAAAPEQGHLVNQYAVALLITARNS